MRFEGGEVTSKLKPEGRGARSRSIESTWGFERAKNHWHIRAAGPAAAWDSTANFVIRSVSNLFRTSGCGNCPHSTKLPRAEAREKTEFGQL